MSQNLGSELAEAEPTTANFPERAVRWLADAAAVAQRQRHCTIDISVLSDRFVVVGLARYGASAQCELSFTCAAAMDTNMLVAAVLRVGRDLDAGRPDASA
jgi:hypothetical protein